MSSLPGQHAPNFELQDDQRRRVRLSDFARRWVVLYFYPQDETPGCNCQADEFTNLIESFQSVGSVVVGISPDPPDVHLRFRQSRRLRITLLSDPDHQVMRLYGAWVVSPSRVADLGRVVRTTFLVDPTGQIVWHWPEVIPEGHAARVHKRLKEFQAASGK